MSLRWPSKNQWRQFFRVLSKKELFAFFILLFLFLGSGFFLLSDFYFDKTEIAPAQGGVYIEGVLGNPRFINPVYAQISDVDRDLVELIFSGLMKYGTEGKLELDLAQEYEVLEQGKIYEFYLKENVFWQDGQRLTADDVVFTVETIQNPDIKSPLRPMWLGVTVEKISGLGVRFTLKNESSIFLENCTLKIIPKHIWENISPQNFSLTPLNLNPVGSGPYRLDIDNLTQDKDGKIISLTLVKNSFYFGKAPYIPKVSFLFFDSQDQAEEMLTKNYNSGQIKGFAPNSVESIPQCTSSPGEPQSCKGGNIHLFSLPRYFAVFFNPKNSKVLSEEHVRIALNYGTNKQDILTSIFSNYGRVVDSPILPQIYGFNEPDKVYQLDIEKAKEILDQAGFAIKEGGMREKVVKRELSFSFKSNLSVGSQGTEVTELQKCLASPSAGGPEIYPDGEVTGYFGSKTKAAVIKFQEKYAADILAPFGLTNGTGDVKAKTREKLNEVCFDKPEEVIPLKISLYTVDQTFLVEVATALKSQWAQLGVEVEIQIFDINTLERDIIRKREFEALLFGEALGVIPDPFPFWHSSQKGELGLNLANYDNKEIDKLLEANRISLDEAERKQKLEEFQNTLIEEAPVVFLYNPDYIYFVSKEIKGINETVIVDPSKRFSQITEWYIKTKRVLK